MITWNPIEQANICSNKLVLIVYRKSTQISRRLIAYQSIMYLYILITNIMFMHVYMHSLKNIM